MRADSRPEKEVYLSIAVGWRRLAEEAARHERRQAGEETRSFDPPD